jgi:hypothetical protein
MLTRILCVPITLCSASVTFTAVDSRGRGNSYPRPSVAVNEVARLD